MAVNVLTLVIQVVIGALTVSGSYVAARRGAREAEVRSRRKEVVAPVHLGR
ncbi:hypothetical protein QM806_39880 [Rhodococcus sp. IEGM 1351]|uniref:hypothetical protein n=1 Tax=Rhodococcus sp. IEGM 1351 TaxID=3047089 RepID=UPI0024B6C3D6|nr:hypothetical protein [Rhodococcus sp. IEGM 1351]MDI9941506.1 hypothetical protein [Rhodococcus sp. IEGM 1351]